MNKRCTAYLKWGHRYSKYKCGNPATHCHKELGELCQYCANEAKAEGLTGIKPMKAYMNFPKSSKTGKEAQPFQSQGCSGGCA